jgi:phenylpropionate dioxygenase-like ring-hydroxylating dioxygenase large terminal subunit
MVHRPTRDDGGVRAFHNVCQHHGARIVAEERGRGAHAFTCPWHGWVYGRDGALRGVPDRGDFAEAQLAGLCAPPVAVEEWGGWPWIHLAGPDAAPPSVESLGEIGDELARYRMQDMVVLEECGSDLPCNYEAVVDGFDETDHIEETHKVGKPPVESSRRTSYAVFGPHSTMVVPLDPRSLESLHEDGDHLAHATRHSVVFPHAVLNTLPEPPQLFQPIPTGPHTTRFVCSELKYADGGAEYDERVENGWPLIPKPIVEQDVDAFERLAKTRDSMARTSNRFNERECKPTAYHAEMARRVGDGLAPGPFDEETP